MADALGMLEAHGSRETFGRRVLAATAVAAGVGLDCGRPQVEAAFGRTGAVIVVVVACFLHHGIASENGVEAFGEHALTALQGGGPGRAESFSHGSAALEFFQSRALQRGKHFSFFLLNSKSRALKSLHCICCLFTWAHF